MNVIAIRGGLGNQMFQYAFGQLMRKRTGEEVCYDASTLFRDKHPRDYGLGEFLCEPKLLDRRTVRRLYKANPFLSLFGHKPQLSYVYEYDALSEMDFCDMANLRNAYLKGYFHDQDCMQEIRPQLCREFRLRNPPAAYLRKEAELADCESVAVHVRRGDYVALGMSDLCPPAYYERAAKRVLEKVPDARFFVFSDDLAWARENLSFLPRVEFVDSPDPMRPALDMMLMKSCRHNVIANSTFSWWSAFLNENPGKVVVAPAKWSMKENFRDKCPEEWERV